MKCVCCDVENPNPQPHQISRDGVYQCFACWSADVDRQFGEPFDFRVWFKETFNVRLA